MQLFLKLVLTVWDVYFIFTAGVKLFWKCAFVSKLYLFSSIVHLHVRASVGNEGAQVYVLNIRRSWVVASSLMAIHN